MDDVAGAAARLISLCEYRAGTHEAEQGLARQKRLLIRAASALIVESTTGDEAEEVLAKLRPSYQALVEDRGGWNHDEETNVRGTIARIQAAVDARLARGCR